jgi:hypothetical protein
MLKWQVKGMAENSTYKEHFRVSIFGSARIKKDDQIYKDIYELSRMIAAEGIDVITGGGPGIMDAANAGHQAGRANDDIHSIGLNIRLPKEQVANRHLDVKKEFDRFSERLDNFMVLSNVVVVAPGGIGTLLELFYTWQLVQVRQICHIPIILFGEMWADLLEWIEEWPLEKGFMEEADLDNVFLAKTKEEVMDIIKAFHGAYMAEEEYTCLNIKRYKLD